MQRKVFRIEQVLARSALTRGAPARPAPGPFAQEFSPLREMLARQAQELSALLLDGTDRRMARAAGELGAVAEAMEKSTHMILKAAEIIGGRTDRLAAHSGDVDASGTTRDIQHQIIRIFEACNFQDLAGQRIGKVIETLCRIDGELSRMLANCAADHPQARIEHSGVVKDALLNGPRLDGEAGHASQGDVDALFD